MLLSLFLIITDDRYDYLQPLRQGLNILVSPFEYAVNWPMSIVARINESFSKQQKLVEENANLRVKLLLQQARLQKMLMLEQENNQLRALLKSQPRSNDRVLVGQLLAVYTDPYIQQVILNKGMKNGVYVGQPVLDANGVFGQVVQTGALTSRVMLITDSRSAVPVQIRRNGIRGILMGNGSTKLSLVNMPMTTDIKIGDELVTSGLGQCYPMGYPVGVITSIVKSSDQEFTHVTVQPSAHLYRSHLVLLIWHDGNQVSRNVN